MAVIRYARQHGTKRLWLARLMDRRRLVCFDWRHIQRDVWKRRFFYAIYLSLRPDDKDAIRATQSTLIGLSTLTPRQVAGELIV